MGVTQEDFVLSTANARNVSFGNFVHDDGQYIYLVNSDDETKLSLNFAGTLPYIDRYDSLYDPTQSQFQFANQDWLFNINLSFYID